MKKTTKLIGMQSCTQNLKLKMRLSLILVFVALLRINANTYSQNIRVSFELRQVTLEELFSKIEEITPYKFLYHVEGVNLSRKVNVSVFKTPLSRVLDDVFKDTDIRYQLLDRQIVLHTNHSDNFSINSVLQQTIIGKVTDTKGNPLLGVTILVKGTQTGTTTDADGQFEIKADVNDILVLTYLGFAKKEVVVGNQKEITVTLDEEASQLEEVVLVGYGSQKRKDITGSVSRVNAVEINKMAPVNFDNAIVGRAPGVYVVPSSGAPGAPAAIRIRGITSVLGNNEPLYVIDGVPIELGQGQGNSFYSESFQIPFLHLHLLIHRT